ncbi:MAG: RsmB/NOP family class I SAM-dependent RNA methyltransferase [Candidatus Woesearchaeota archaeon]
MIRTIPLNNALSKRYEQLGCACSEPITLRNVLRVNTLKIDEQELVQRLKTLKIRIEKIPFLDHGYFYDAPFSLASTTEYLLGYFYIQEAASQLPVHALDIKPGMYILDMAASPGSKTTQMAQCLENKGIIIALDIDSRRLLSLRNNLERCGVTNTVLYKKDARFAFDLHMQFDRVLLDAPCTGNYVIEKEFFKIKNIPGIMGRARIQKELLKAAVKVLKKDGIFVYSTCSLEPEENELNINWFLNKFPEMQLVETGIKIGDPGLTTIFKEKLDPSISKCRRLWPEKTGTQGFFIAKLKKVK